MSFPETDQDFSFDPDLPPHRPRSSNRALIVVLLSLGALLLVGTVALLAIWQPFRAERLPPREEEPAEERYRETVDAFGKEGTDADPQQLAEVRKLFLALRRAFQTAQPDQIEDLFDAKRMYQEIRRLGGMDELSVREERRLIAGLGKGICKSMTRNADFFAFDRFEIKRCKLLDTPDEAVVYVRFWDSDGFSTKYRWWIRRHSDGWRVYDFEELSGAMRASNMASISFGFFANSPQSTVRARTEMAEFADACRAIAAEDWEAAEQQLAELDFSWLPGRIRAVEGLMEAVVHLGLERYQEALESCDRAESLNSDMPVLSLLRAMACNGLGRHEEARKMAETFLARLGDDADTYVQLGDALAGLGREQEAADAYRKGLDDDPDSLDSLYGLGTVLAPDSKDELGQRLGKMRRPREQFEMICELFLAERDTAALKSLIGAYEKIAPKDPDVAYYTAQVMYIGQRYDEAAATVKGAIMRVPDEEKRVYFVDLYLDSVLAGDGDAVAAYREAPDARYAFERLANLAVDANDADLLAKLIAARREDKPDQVDLRLWDAWACLLKGDYGEALQTLEEEGSAILSAPDNDWMYYRVKVRSLVGLDKLDGALAAANEAEKRFDDPWLPAVVHAARGDVPETLKWLNRCEEEYYTVEDFYADPVLASALRSPPFAEVRRQFPDPARAND